MGKPLIQYAAEEASVTNAPSKTTLITIKSSTWLFGPKGKYDQAEMDKNILPAGVKCIFVHQPEQLGFGHAVLFAESVVGDDPFVVLLVDDFLTYEGDGIVSDLVSAYELSGKTQMSVMEVNGPDSFKYGVVVPDGGSGSVAGLVEKSDAHKHHLIWPALDYMLKHRTFLIFYALSRWVLLVKFHWQMR